MCGICGIYNFRRSECVDADVLAKMNRLLTHRGPDDEGYHLDGPLGIAMRRLIIIDPDTGHQPLYSEDHKAAVVCNGEIYNFRALRDQLTDRGHCFRSRSDCEVIVHLYEEQGAELMTSLRGMFALALWDAERKLLLLARDRIGIKPLYFAETQGTLLFASELKAILAHPALERRVDRRALHHYLSLNYVPAPHTLVEGVEQLLPGELLLCTPNGLKKKVYWDLRFHRQDGLNEDQWAELVRNKLEECVESHLVSDVPFGAFLSGGVDSSAVVTLMSDILAEPVSTFSIAFAEKTYSEAAYSRLMAGKMGSDHHEITASPDVVSLLPILIWHADDPLADSSMIPVYLLSRFARERVTMVLTGDGGDEVFAGYDTYNAYFVRRLYRKIPAPVRLKLIKKVVERLPVSLTKVSFDFKAKRFVAGAELDDEEAHFWWRVILSEEAKSRLYTPEFAEGLDLRPTAGLFKDYFRSSGSADPLSRMLYVDTRLYLPADMLTKVDRMTMANALEARVPFLDHELVELAARIPSQIKFKGRQKKYILKKALAGRVPPEILRRKKAGFNVPVNAWLAGELAPFASSVLDPERIASSGFFRPQYVSQLLSEHRERKRDHSYSLWGLICFQLWFETFIAPEQVEPPAEVKARWGIGSEEEGR